jgi:hypothetical protein
MAKPYGIFDNPTVFMAIMRASAVKCKHPFTFSVTEMAAFLGAIASAPYFYMAATFGPKFFVHSINGAIMTELTMDILINQLELSVGDAVTFDEVKRIFLTPVPPINIGGQTGRDVPKVDLTFYIKSVTQIEEVKFEFDATFDIVMRWTDANMWAECYGNGKTIDQGQCQYVWKPMLTFPNGRAISINEDRRFLWTKLQSRSATYQMEISGTFLSPMTFKQFPMDTHDLPITIALNDVYGDLSRAQLHWGPVSALIDPSLTYNKGDLDKISGWDVMFATATEHAYMSVDMPDLQTSNVTASTCMITVHRTTFFFLINYVLIIVLLTSVSWITFIMDPHELSDRCGIPLTMLLALNVFQLILSDLMPKTGYLTPMHEFVIVSTFFTVFAAVESMMVNLLHKQVERKRCLYNLSSVPSDRLLYRIESFLAAHADHAALVVFPVAYGVYVSLVFG